MTILTFASAAQLGAVMSALPAASAAQCTAVQNSDGSYALSVPADLVAAVSAINPSTAAAAALKAQLIAYANSKLAALLAVSRSYTLATNVTVLCDSTSSTGVNLLSLTSWGQANPAATQSWIDDFGTVTTITGAEAVTLADAVLAYGQSVYAVLASACAGIASATLTTPAQIDALAWPV